jgi:hypothetical protein
MTELSYQKIDPFTASAELIPKPTFSMMLSEAVDEFIASIELKPSECEKEFRRAFRMLDHLVRTRGAPFVVMTVGDSGLIPLNFEPFVYVESNADKGVLFGIVSRVYTLLIEALDVISIVCICVADGRYLSACKKFYKDCYAYSFTGPVWYDDTRRTEGYQEFMEASRKADPRLYAYAKARAEVGSILKSPPEVNPWTDEEIRRLRSYPRPKVTDSGEPLAYVSRKRRFGETLVTFLCCVPRAVKK